jgi:hypothetical protein
MSGYTTTPNVGLKKPITGSDNDLWGDHLNSNADLLDTLLAGGGGGGGGGGSPVAISQTVVTLTANTDATLVPANSARKSLALITTGAGDVTLGFGGAAVLGQGWPLPAASASTKTGVPMLWELSPPVGSVHGISASNTTVVVLEGV